MLYLYSFHVFPGWQGVLCDHNFDECTLAPCARNQICIDTPGSYLCQCPAGYQKINEMCQGSRIVLTVAYFILFNDGNVSCSRQQEEPFFAGDQTQDWQIMSHKHAVFIQSRGLMQNVSICYFFQ